MVRIHRRVSVGAAALALVVAAAPRGSSSSGISLELHRLPASEKRYETYQRRRLDMESDGFESVPLNPGMGTHYAWVYAGTPPQRASVITDTGSSIMAFPCTGCDGCGTHTDAPFVMKNSSTLTYVTCNDPSFFQCQGCGGADNDKKTCEISQSYMEGSSWHATVVEDLVYLGGDDSFHDLSLRDTFGTHFKFGCQTSETGLFITQVADGIMGLSNSDNHIVAKLFKEQKIPNKLFTLCFAPEGGAMSIGAPDTSRHKGEISYAKLIKTVSHDFYGVELRDVRIAGASIGAPKTTFQYGSYIVDSGTTDSYLPSSMKQAFKAAFQAASGLEYHISSSRCQGYTAEQLDTLPSVEFILGAEDGGNVTLVVPPSQYLLQEENGKFCSSIFLSEGSGGVIGANIMMDHDVIFDQGNQRVGFVEADCDFRRAAASGIPPVNMSSSLPPSPATSPEPTVLSTTQPPVATPVVESASPALTETKAPAPSMTLGTTSTPIPSVNVPQPPRPAISTAAPVTEAPTTEPPATSAPTTEAPTTTPPVTTAVPATEAPDTEAPDTEAPDTDVPDTEATTTEVSEAPEPTATKSDVVADLNTAAKTASNDAEDDQPLVVPIVGACLAVAFIIAAVMSVRRHKKAKRAKKWRRVKETEEDDDEDDDEDGLMGVHTPGQGKVSKSTRPNILDEFDDSDDDDIEEGTIRQDARLPNQDDASSDKEDDDDEIFDRDVADEGEGAHDAKMLEQL